MIGVVILLEAKINKYFIDEIDSNYKVIVNYKNRRLVFKDKAIINGKEKIIYIKKYIPYKKPKRLIILGLKDDPCTHYKKISEKLKSININVIESVLSVEKRDSFFHRKYILVTPDVGKSLREHEKENEKYFENHKNFYIKYFDYFILMCKNNIYPTDYNLGGCLVNENKICLIDLDSYKLKKKMDKKLIKKMLHGFEDDYLLSDYSEEFLKFYMEQLERVKKELGWDIILNGSH